MLIFSTILPVKDSLTIESFFALGIKWNQSCASAEFRIQDIKWNSESEIRFGTEELWLEFDEDKERRIALMHYERVDPHGIIWDLDFVLNLEDYRLAIQLSRSYTDDAVVSLNDYFYAPRYISLLIEGGYLQTDGELPVLEVPHCLSEDVLDQILRQGDCNLPVVSVTPGVGAECPLDVYELAGRLRGVAHVVTIDLERISNLECSNYVENNGEVRIYYPTTKTSYQSVCSRKVSCSGCDKEQLENIIDHVMRFCASRIIPASYDRLCIQQEKLWKELWVEYERLSDSTSTILEDRISELTHEITRLRIENQALMSRMREKGRFVILSCENDQFHNFYPNEIKGIVLSALRYAQRNMFREDSRSYRVIDALFDRENQSIFNQVHSEQERLKKEIHSILDTYDGENRVTQRLREIGFTVERTVKHLVIRYHGDRDYQFTLPSTPSDWRSGKNAAAEIIKKIF